MVDRYKMKKQKIMPIVFAVACALILMNILCFYWNFYPKTYNSDKNYSKVVLEPGGHIVSCKEG